MIRLPSTEPDLDEDETNKALDVFDEWYKKISSLSYIRGVIDKVSAREAWLRCWQYRNEEDERFSRENRSDD